MVVFQPPALYATADRRRDIGKRLASVEHKANNSLRVAVENQSIALKEG